MRHYSTLVSKVFVAAIFGILLAASTQAQVSLRKALDYDNDGKADFSIFRPGDKAWYVFTSTGGVIAQSWGDFTTDFLTPGDYDGDGKSDISVFRDTAGMWFTLNSSDSTVSFTPWGTTGDEPVARDYDGDGKTDFAVVRRTGAPTTGTMTWYILRSSGGGFDAIQWGIPADVTAPGDYDGDGKFDVCVQRYASLSAQANFYALQSSNGALMATQWGIGSDFVVPGDYDGDGKTDIAVVREGETEADQLTWFVYNSGSGSITIAQWGLSGTDHLTPNDYDGDGKVDLAVWRETNGTFYVYRSSDGGIISVPWGIGGDFPVAEYDVH